MLRGLVIRQFFVASDWLVVGLIVCGAGFAGWRLFGGVWTRDVADLEQGVEVPESDPSTLAQIRPRTEYDRIVASSLFGPAGQTKRNEGGAELAPSPEETETQLRLKLCGTAATSPRDLYASAVILNEDDNSMRTYGLGQAVVPNVTLEEVYQRKVVLFNGEKNRREILRSEEIPQEAGKGGPGATPASSPTPVAAAPSGNRISVKKQELVNDLLANYTDIATQIKPEMYRDANGNVAGITASNLESIAIAKKLGVKNGDVLQTVNNEAIDSEQKIGELVNKYRNSNTFRIGILRGGKPMVITYKLE